MIFNNINNIPAVKDFEILYGGQLCKDYPELVNLDIRIYTDQQGDGQIKYWDDSNDSPYTSNHLFNEIMRSEEAYNKCNFTIEEEFAILAHELGHIVAGKRGEKSVDNLQEEMNADKMAASLGLACHMQVAIQKMIDAKLKPSNNAEMRQRIDAL
ncbi:MAG: hypothetical protein J6T22_11825 [Bacteroidales bacterium]|jgi:hypothetical protein|nr:hypothetical protein [Bacteroidales bacterium]